MANTLITNHQYGSGFEQLEGRSTVFLGVFVHNGVHEKPRIIARGTDQEGQQVSRRDLMRGFNEVFGAHAEKDDESLVLSGGVRVFNMDKMGSVVMGPIPLELNMIRGWKDPQQPVLGSWYAFSGFAALFPDEDFSLPTGKEWGVAAGELRDERYWDIKALREVAHFHERKSIRSTIAVKSKKPNQYGLFDMLGNAWELMSNTFLGSEYYREMRGGCWNTDAESMRVGFCTGTDPHQWTIANGFRLRRPEK